MSTKSPDGDSDYLWDRAGPPDPEVQALEDLLGRFAHSGRSGPEQRTAPPRPRHRAWALPLAAAVFAAIALVIWQADRGSFVQSGDGIQLELIAGGLPGEEGEFLVAGASGAVLQLTGESGNWIGDLSLSPGSRFGIETLSRGLAHLTLGSGHLEVSLSDASPSRFFQVDTPSALCVGLGGAYTLDVDELGASQVVVTRGRVSFEDREGIARYVPAGAECKAFLDLGLGTPRFPTGTPGFTALLDEFDAALGETAATRRGLADRLGGTAAHPRDTLALWHLLNDPDGQIRDRAETALIRIAGLPPAALRVKAVTFSSVQWLAHLEELWR